MGSKSKKKSKAQKVKATATETEMEVKGPPKYFPDQDHVIQVFFQHPEGKS